jgi:hypothetical protein
MSRRKASPPRQHNLNYRGTQTNIVNTGSYAEANAQAGNRGACSISGPIAGLVILFIVVGAVFAKDQIADVAKHVATIAKDNIMKSIFGR